MHSKYVDGATTSLSGLVLPLIGQFSSRSTLWLLLIGMVLDWSLTMGMRHLGASPVMAQVLGFLGSAAPILWSSLRLPTSGHLGFWCRCLIGGLLALGLRGALVQGAVDVGMAEPWVWLPAIVISAVVTVLGFRSY